MSVVCDVCPGNRDLPVHATDTVLTGQSLANTAVRDGTEETETLDFNSTVVVPRFVVLLVRNTTVTRNRQPPTER